MVTNPKPISLESLKRRAKAKAKAEGITHTAALELLALDAGYASYRQMSAKLESERRPNPNIASVRARGVISGVGDGAFRGGACPTPECSVAGGHRAHRYGGVCILQP